MDNWGRAFRLLADAWLLLLSAAVGLLLSWGFERFVRDRGQVAAVVLLSLAPRIAVFVLLGVDRCAWRSVRFLDGARLACALLVSSPAVAGMLGIVAPKISASFPVIELITSLFSLSAARISYRMLCERLERPNARPARVLYGPWPGSHEARPPAAQVRRNRKVG